jgi:hypothetical protein
VGLELIFSDVIAVNLGQINSGGNRVFQFNSTKSTAMDTASNLKKYLSLEASKPERNFRRYKYLK